MALFALSCTRCFGLTTLLSNMLYSTPYHASLHASLSPSKAEYRFGVAHEAYSISLPICCALHPWRAVVGAVYARYGVILLGRVKLSDEEDELSPEWIDMSPNSDELVGEDCEANLIRMPPPCANPVPARERSTARETPLVPSCLHTRSLFCGANRAQRAHAM
eukprot:1125252-Prymnesium_polylepis.1